MRRRRGLWVLGALLVAGAVGALVLSRHRAPGGRPRSSPPPATRPRGGRPPQASRRTFYVSPSGDDSADGRSPATAWRTVRAVDRATLRPGDVVRFRGGRTFRGAPLAPGGGAAVSGRPDAPVTFSSYGGGRARIVQGVFFRGDSYLTFRGLTLGSSSGIAGRGLQGTGNHITIERLLIAHAALGIESVGDHWTIADSEIRDTGNSGMLLGFDAGRPGDPPGGQHYVITHNLILDTGLDRRLSFGTHGIYLKVADATVTDNTITGFRDDGISVRYRNNTITGNRISHGAIGLAWFQYDDRRGTSVWKHNQLTAIGVAGVFICQAAQGCRRPIERFSIADNTVQVR